MTSDVPFQGLLMGCSFFVGLVVAFDLFVFVGYFDTDEARAAALIGAALALVALITIVALLVAGRRSLRRMRQIVGGDYLVRWRYAHGEWRQFVLQERARAIRAALLLFPILLACIALLALLSDSWGDPFLAESIPILLLLAAAVLVGLVYAVAGRRPFARRAQMAGDTYISRLGVIRPDGRRSLGSLGYHLAAVRVQPGAPMRLRFVLQPGRALSVLDVLGANFAPFEVIVPVPDGHEEEAAQVAAQLSRSSAWVCRPAAIGAAFKSGW
jgi:hypothetical protein